MSRVRSNKAILIPPAIVNPVYTTPVRSENAIEPRRFFDFVVRHWHSSLYWYDKTPFSSQAKWHIAQIHRQPDSLKISAHAPPHISLP